MTRIAFWISDAIQIVLYYALSWTIGLMVWALIASILMAVFGPVVGLIVAIVLFFSRGN